MLQVFRELKRFDLGCGFGGGKNGQEVLKVNFSIFLSINSIDVFTFFRKGLGSSVSIW